METIKNFYLFFNVRPAKSVIIHLFFIAVVLSFFAAPCFSQERPAQAIEEVLESPKLNLPDEILRGFMEGKATARVIVNLSYPPGLTGSRNFKDMTIRQQLQEEVEAAQDRVINAMDPGNVRVTNRFTYIFGFSAEVILQGLEDLINKAEVLSIDEDMILHANLNQGIPLINATTVRSSYNGSGMAIAICDTGIDYTHPQLGGGGFPNTKVIGGYDTGQNDPDPMDGHGHGTCCAGIAAGPLGTYGDYIGGVAYNAKLYALKMTYTSTGGSAWTSDMVEAWEWCITHQNDDPGNPIMIISTSFGGGRYYNQSSCDARVAAMTAAAANAKAAGITLFCSSGNNGYTDSTGWPGCLSDVIGIGAVYDANIGSRYLSVCTDLSTSADRVTCYSNSASFLGLFAPSNDAYTLDIAGSGGYSTGNYYSSFGGTSAACPYAAGAGACLQSAAKAKKGSYLTPDQVETYLKDNGDLVTDPKVPSITKPRVNLGKAVSALQTIRYVDRDGTCGGKTPCYSTIQAAINAAGIGDPIRITAETYNENVNLNQNKALTLEGGWNSSFTTNPSTTVLNGQVSVSDELTTMENMDMRSP